MFTRNAFTPLTGLRFVALVDVVDPMSYHCVVNEFMRSEIKIQRTLQDGHEVFLSLVKIYY
jgi:hypothetical protein